MKVIKIPHLDTPVSRLGLGCMGMSEFYGPTSDTKAALALMTEAFDQGVQLFDSADFYGDGDNERLIGKFIRESQRRPVIATKCGIVRSAVILDDGNFRREYNGQPNYIRQACEASLERLGVDCIDLFYLHRIDPAVSIEASVGALADLVQQGKVKAIGLSEASPETIRRGHAVHPISALQSEYSLWSRQVEEAILPTCRELGILFVPYAPLGRGMVPAHRGDTLSFAEGDFRATLERADQDNLERNQPLFELLYDTADRLKISAFQLMLSWLFAQGDDLLPIPGSRQLKNLQANIAAERVVLPQDLIDTLSAHFTSETIAGGRYTVNKQVAANAAQMNDR